MGCHVTFCTVRIEGSTGFQPVTMRIVTGWKPVLPLGCVGARRDAPTGCRIIPGRIVMRPSTVFLTSSRWLRQAQPAEMPAV